MSVFFPPCDYWERKEATIIVIIVYVSRDYCAIDALAFDEEDHEFVLFFFKDHINCTTICQRRSRGMQSRRCVCNGKNGIISERADSFSIALLRLFAFVSLTRARVSCRLISNDCLRLYTLYSFTRVFSDFPRLATERYLSSLQCVRIESRVIFHDRTRDRSPVSLTFSRYFIGSSLLVFLFFFLCILASVAWQSCDEL